MPKQIIETLAQVEAPGPHGFCAGIVLWGDGDAFDLVVEAAPILRRQFKGKRRAYVRAVCLKKGWRVHVVHQLKRTHPRAL